MANRHFNLNRILSICVILIFMAFSFTDSSPFQTIETAIYDLGLRRAFSGDRGIQKITLVEIDEKSVKRLGPLPWPRDRIAEMLNLLKDAGTALIGLQIPLAERNTGPGLKAIKVFRDQFKAYASSQGRAPMASWVLENLMELEVKLDQDRRLIKGVRDSGNVILPVLGITEIDLKRGKGRLDPSLSKNFMTPGNVSKGLKKRHAVDRLSLPFPDLREASLGLGHGHLSAVGKMSGRSHPLFISYRGALIPSFPLRLAMAALPQKPKQVIVEENRIRLKGRTIPTIDGEMLIPFQDIQNPFPRLSFADILKNRKVSGGLKGKIILIGLNGSNDRRLSTPVRDDMSELELTARILDGIINNRFISRAPFAGPIEILALLVLGCFAFLFFPRMGQLGRLGLMIVLCALVLITGIILFSMMHTWIRTVSIVGCLVTIYLIVSIIHLFTSGRVTKDSIETNRLLGLSFQSQGLFDLALDKFKKLPLDNKAKDLIYNLGLEYERKGAIKKALEAFEIINKGDGFRDLNERILQLKASDKSTTISGGEIVQDDGLPAGSIDSATAKLGRYEILGELGKGSMGLVYKALDPKINRLLAIKTIRFADEFDEDVIQEIKERFFREAEIAGQLSHPSIVTIYDVGEYQDLTYMAMEFLEGDDLEHFITKKNLLPLRRILDIVAKVAEALDFAHKAEVIHRDIKPANIMLLKKGGVKVTDFGIAKAISSSRTKTGVILGTPNYMSPEQIMGQKIDHRSDIFSLGVLFYQLLTGDTPFHGDNLSALLYQITQVSQPSVRMLNPKIPKVCEQIINKALAKDPDERFKDAGEMARYLKVLASKIDQLKEKDEMKS